MPLQVIPAQGERDGHDQQCDREGRRCANDALFADDFHDAKQSLGPQNIDCDQEEREQMDAAVSGQLAIDDAIPLRDAQFVPVKSGEEP